MNTIQLIRYISLNPNLENVVIGDLDDRTPMQAIELLSSSFPDSDDWRINSILEKNTLLVYTSTGRLISKSDRISVKDYKDFALFNYESEPNYLIKLGNVVYKHTPEDKSIDQTELNEIGVVIQTYSDGDFRTDMFGNSSMDEVSFATIEQIEKYRPELLKHI